MRAAAKGSLLATRTGAPCSIGMRKNGSCIGCEGPKPGPARRPKICWSIAAAASVEEPCCSSLPWLQGIFMEESETAPTS